MTELSEHATAAEHDLRAAEEVAAQTAAASGERATLNAILDYLRAGVVSQVAGLSDEDARRRLVPSLTTPAGMLRHLTAVERNWFRVCLRGETRETVGVPSSPRDESWEVPDSATVASLIAEYQRACAESREIAAGFALDDTAINYRLGRVSLRWILVHMIEETARHAGHVDILREQLDGTTAG